MLERPIRYPLSWRNLPSLLALIAAVLVALAPMAAIAATQATTGNQIAQIPEPVDLAEARARTLKAEQELATREAAIHIEANLRADAYAQFQVIAGLFGILISAIVIFFSFQSQRLAGAAAAKAAREEMADATKHIDALRTEAARATDEAKKATEAANAAAANAAAAYQKAEAAAAATHKKRGDIEADVEAISKMTRETAAMFEGMKPRPEPSKQPPLTPEEIITVEAVAKANSATPELQWSIDQFITAIGKAMYVDENWTEAERLAAEMEQVHRTDNDARLFALIGRGDAALQLGRYRDAVTAYEAAITITTKTPKIHHERDYLWVTEHLAVCLVHLTRAAEAEVMLRGLLPHLERIDGPEGPETLTARNNLAIAILNQGRASEAEAMYRELLPIRERVDGPEASQTLSTRHNLARTLLDQGRAAEAEAILRAIVPLCERVDGPKASRTLSTRSSLAAAIRDQGRAAEAEAMYRELLPLHEGVDGIEASATLTTRHNLACAILDQGRTAEAESILNELLRVREQVIGPEATVTLLTRCWWADALVRMGDVAGAAAALAPIPDLVPRNDWPPRGHATLAFVRGRVADALGDRAAADAYLARADQIYASIYPPEHVNRVTLAAYRASRVAGDGGDA